jgi:hypothetical protein
MAALPYSVYCKSTYLFFERIAAFDCEAAALGYARECAVASPAYEYRVVHGKKVTAVAAQVAA